MEEHGKVEQSRSKPHIIEALIFGSDEPLTARQIVAIISSAEDTRSDFVEVSSKGGSDYVGITPKGGLTSGRQTPTDEVESRQSRTDSSRCSTDLRIRITEDEVLQHIRELNAHYVQAGRAFRIIQVAGGYQFATMPEYADWLGKMVKEKAKRKLSPSALETLAVIAYKQPVTKPEIEAIRGVGADYVIGTLLERGLITIVGRAATPGRPLLYGTTQDFLKHFGINDLADLPKPREIDEIMREPGFELEKELLRRMGKSEEDIEDIQGKTVVGEDGVIRKIDPDKDATTNDQEEQPS